MQHKHTQTNEAEDAVAVAEAASEAAIDAARPARDIKVLMLGKLSALRLNRDRLISERNRRKFDGHDTDAVDADLAGVRGEIRRFKLHQPPQFKRYLMGIDCAATSNDGSDFSAAVVVGVTENAWYVVDVVRRASHHDS